MKKIIPNSIYEGDWIKHMAQWEEHQIDMVITSPPYWKQRDYNHPNQLGQESTVDQYIATLLTGFKEIKRLLVPEGTCWVNMGDKYNDTCLLNIPFKFAIAICNDGWILRNTIIWEKPNAMPDSTENRFTVDFEYLFFFVKQTKYYFDQQSEKGKGILSKPWSTKSNKKEYIVNNPRSNFHPIGGTKQSNGYNPTYSGKSWSPKPFIEENVNGHYNPESDYSAEQYTKRNKRCVWKSSIWEIPTEPHSESHAAAFPRKLIETPIKAGSPPNGIVFDPFFGIGTTGLVCQQLKRKFVGTELNPEYVNIAKKKLHLDYNTIDQYTNK